MSGQATPGPWAWRDERRGGPGIIIETERPDDGGVGEVVAWTTGYGFAHEVANARLIHAAPDLLFALQSLLWRVENHYDEGPEASVEGLAARAAIAKATGVGVEA